MASYVEKQKSFQLGLLLFLVLSLSAGVVLASGNASLSFLPHAAGLVTKYASPTPVTCVMDQPQGWRVCRSDGKIEVCHNGKWVIRQDCLADGYTGCVGTTRGQGGYCVHKIKPTLIPSPKPTAKPLHGQ